MRSRHPASAPLLLLAALGVAPSALLAQTVPAAASTSTTAPAATPRAGHPGHRADIAFTNGLLTINANNASLNQVIREIARQTGMKVTGAVMEDRVFGSYGPAEPSQVLATLLDGTGSNLLIVQTAADQPKELILTQRIGAPTPPNPNAAALEAAADADNDEQAQPPATFPRRGFPNRPPPPNANPAVAPRHPSQDVGGVSRDPAAIVPSTTDQTVTFPQVDPNTPPSTGTTTPIDQQDETDQPAKTPQEIFQELQRLQQQKPQ